jgi:hypothetical protein
MKDNLIIVGPRGDIFDAKINSATLSFHDK